MEFSAEKSQSFQKSISLKSCDFYALWCLTSFMQPLLSFSTLSTQSAQVEGFVLLL